MNDKVKTVYIAGPITGDPKYKSKFSAAADMLMKLRYAVVNPVKMCWDIRWNPRYEVLAECFKAVAGVDRLALLPGWENSKGAKAELYVFKNTHDGNAYVIIMDKDCKRIDVTNLVSYLDVDSIYEEDEDIKRAIHHAKNICKLELNPR